MLFCKLSFSSRDSLRSKEVNEREENRNFFAEVKIFLVSEKALDIFIKIGDFGGLKHYILKGEYCRFSC